MQLPDHVKKFCKEIPEDDIFSSISSDLGDDSFSVVRAECDCGCDTFSLFKSACPTAIAVCTKCGKHITVYDLKYYPNAEKNEADDKLSVYLTEGGKNFFRLCMGYEYSDKPKPDDPDFDCNDIKGFNLWANPAGSDEVILVLNDETGDPAGDPQSVSRR